MSLDVSRNLPPVVVPTSTPSCSSVSSTGQSFSDVLERVSLIRDVSLNNDSGKNEVSTYLCKMTGKSEIGSLVNLEVKDGKVDSTVNDVYEGLKAKPFYQITTSGLSDAGQKYQNAHKCESIA